LATKPGEARTDYCPDAGDLVWIDLNPTLGHQPSGHRPALVLTAKSYNTVAGLCVVCPITSRVRSYPFEVALPEGAALSGVVLADQPRSVSWQKRHVRSAGRAPAALLDDVRGRLHALLGAS
jgi:mRNA interferase MazF